MFGQTTSRCEAVHGGRGRRLMRRWADSEFVVFGLLIAVGIAMSAVAQQGDPSGPAENLPPYIRRLTHFGQRADFSHDGKRILFIEKTYGDVYELDLSDGELRPLTHHYYHEGYTRALYLADGNILLSGARSFDAQNPDPSRWSNAELWVLDKSLSGPPVPLGVKCSEGPAVSRTKMRIAWTMNQRTNPDEIKSGSQMWLADIVYRDGRAELTNKRLVLDNTKLPFKASLETQNFRPPDEKELTFAAYNYQGTEVMGVNLETGKITDYSNAPGQYDEPEGIFPDGRFTCVESDRESGATGIQHIDIWKLRLDGSGAMERLTSFNRFPGYKATNPVVSDDGHYMAFQMAKFGDPPGVGRGLFLMDLTAAAR